MSSLNPNASGLPSARDTKRDEIEQLSSNIEGVSVSNEKITRGKTTTKIIDTVQPTIEKEVKMEPVTVQQKILEQTPVLKEHLESHTILKPEVIEKTVMKPVQEVFDTMKPTVEVRTKMVPETATRTVMKEETVMKPHEEQYTVMKPVTVMKEFTESRTVMKPETIVKPVEESYTVMKPKAESVMVMKPATETRTVLKPEIEKHTVMKPVTETRKVIHEELEEREVIKESTVMKPVVHEKVITTGIDKHTRSDVKDLGTKVESVGVVTGGIVSDVVTERHMAPVDTAAIARTSTTTTTTAAPLSHTAAPLSYTAAPLAMGALKPKVLIAVTSAAPRLGGHTSGYFWSEVYEPYIVFTHAGYECDFISLTGHAEIDSNSTSHSMMSDDAYKAYGDKKHKLHIGLSKLFKPSDINISNYCGIFFAGGHACMWDFPSGAALQQLAAQIYERGGVIGAVCHGTCALGGIRLSNGTPLIQGRKITGFPTAAEQSMGVLDELTHKFGLKTTELMIRESGGIWSEPKNDPMSEWVVEDERLITGSNPASARICALKMLTQLKRVAPIQTGAATTVTSTATSAPVIENYDILKERTVEHGAIREQRKERI